MRSSEKEKLLNDLIRDPNYEAFRSEVYDLSLAEFRGLRRYSARTFLAIAASIVLAGGLALTFFRPSQPSQNATTAPIHFQSDQRPIIPSVASRPLEIVEVVRSLPNFQTGVATSARRGAVETVQSSLATVDPVDDAELFALFPNNSVGFVHTSEGKKLFLSGRL